MIFIKKSSSNQPSNKKNMFSRYMRIRWTSMRSNWMLWLIATLLKHSSASDQQLKKCSRRTDTSIRVMWICWILKRRKKDKSPHYKPFLRFSNIQVIKKSSDNEVGLSRSLAIFWSQVIKTVADNEHVFVCLLERHEQIEC